MILKKIFFKLMNNTVFEKKKIELLNLSQQKKEGIIQHQNQIIILLSFSQKIYKQQKSKKRNTYE